MPTVAKLRMLKKQAQKTFSTGGAEKAKKGAMIVKKKAAEKLASYQEKYDKARRGGTES